jgi:hypothetical protein
MKLICMADGLFLYRTNNHFIVTDQDNNILKEAKTVGTCDRYILQVLHSRRAAEKYASSLKELKSLGIL